MLVGYVRVFSADDRQTVDLQRDALVTAAVDHRHLHIAKASGARDGRPGLRRASQSFAVNVMSLAGSSKKGEASCPSDRCRRWRYPKSVPALRRLLLAHRHVAALICVAAFALKLMVPAGYMVSSDHGRIAITICSGVALPSMNMAMPGMHGDMADHGKSKEHGKPEIPCAFISLSAQALGAVDPILLIIAITFVISMGLRFIARPTIAALSHLRPPLRGPPATA